MSLYLSRLSLDLRSPQVISELTHPHEMHRTLMRGFPTASDAAGRARAEFGVLFRPEVGVGVRTARVLVQSSVEPDWSFLSTLKRYLMGEGTSGWECRDLTRALQAIRRGQTLAFRLRANPTRRVADAADVLRGKRVELQHEAEQIEWLVGKGRGGRDGVPGGFEIVTTPVAHENGSEIRIPQVRVRPEGKLTAWKKESVGGHRLTHLAVVFDGLLRVTDVEALQATVRQGVGSGKAYGFGLLSLAPPSAFGLGDAP